MNHIMNFIQYPKKYLEKGHHEGGSPNFDDLNTTTPTEDGTSRYVKGRGTMKGRSPTLKLNKGVKGLGRKSLRIGTGGMGKPIKNKYETWKSGQYTRSH